MKTFEQFTTEMHNILEGSARQKAYNDTGVDGPNQLFDFIYNIADMGHALGEIVYKVIRYRAKQNPEDLIKVASWAFLAWRKHYEVAGNQRPSEPICERQADWDTEEEAWWFCKKHDGWHNSHNCKR